LEGNQILYPVGFQGTKMKIRRNYDRAKETASQYKIRTSKTNPREREGERERERERESIHWKEEEERKVSIVFMTSPFFFPILYTT
jgi:hypothetical protein